MTRTTGLTLGRAVAALLLAALMLRIAWIGDDSLITLRALLNLSHGWGPGFNAFEAVQSSTHPLWFLTWLTVGGITGDWIVPILVISVAMSATAAYLVLRRVVSLAGIIAVVGSLALSNAFMEYSSSGLENPLAYLFVAILILISTREQSTNIWTALAFGASAAGLFLTRFDLVLVLIPVGLLFIWKVRGERRNLTAAALAFALPAVIWFAWSLSTYSVLFPNTLAAKQNTDIPRIEFLVQGLRYLWVSIEHDPVTLAILLAGVVGAVISRSWTLRSWMMGTGLYLVYVVWIGGDFMSGRFLAVPVFISAAVFGIALGPRTQTHTGRDAVFAGLGVSALLLATAPIAGAPTSVSPPTQPRWDFGTTAGVADEFGYHLQFSRDLRQVVMGLGRPLSVPPYQAPDAIDPAVTLSSIRSAAATWPTAPNADLQQPSAVVPQYGFLGTTGLLVGPTVHLVDRYALTDRFLAEQTYSAAPFQWRIGHFDRGIPDGYLEAIATGDPQLVKDPQLRLELEQLWDEIRQP